MATNQKKSIYLTGTLIDIYDECHSKERNRSFSGRIADIAERYEALLSLTDTPALTAEEKMILGEAVSGTFIDKLKLKYLPEAILDTQISGCSELADKVSRLDYVQRLGLIEELGI